MDSSDLLTILREVRRSIAMIESMMIGSLLDFQGLMGFISLRLTMSGIGTALIGQMSTRMPITLNLGCLRQLVLSRIAIFEET